MLTGKHVLLGVTGGIAAYKACDLASKLMKQHADVNVIMTENATKFVTPLTFDALTHNRTVTDPFDRSHSYEIEHIALADKADAVMIAPASADVIAKLACGIADDMLTTTVLACDCPKMIAPAMNTKMYENPVTQRNLKQLREDGWDVIEPDEGYLACGAVGKGKLVSPDILLEAIGHAIALPKDLSGRRILVTAGPTEEPLDPVRYLTNRSTGKMGYAIAKAASQRGADVTLVSGPTDLPPLRYVNMVNVITAQDMYEAVTSRFCRDNSSASESSRFGMDAVIMAAAVADFRPASYAEDKIKKMGSGEHPELPLEKTEDILSCLGAHRQKGQILCGFSMETKDMLENSREKLEKKHLDMIAANNVKVPGAGFAVDTNVLTLITKEGATELPLMSKYDAANALLDRLAEMM